VSTPCGAGDGGVKLASVSTPCGAGDGGVKLASQRQRDATHFQESSKPRRTLSETSSPLVPELQNQMKPIERRPAPVLSLLSSFQIVREPSFFWPLSRASVCVCPGVQVVNTAAAILPPLASSSCESRWTSTPSPPPWPFSRGGRDCADDGNLTCTNSGRRHEVLRQSEAASKVPSRSPTSQPRYLPMAPRW